MDSDYSGNLNFLNVKNCNQSEEISYVFSSERNHYKTDLTIRKPQTARPRLINSTSEKEIRPALRRRSSSNMSWDIDQSMKIHEDDFKDSGINLSGLEISRKSNECFTNKHRRLPVQKHRFLGTDPRFRRIHRSSTLTSNKSDDILEPNETDITVMITNEESKPKCTNKTYYQNELETTNALDFDEKAQQTEMNVISSHTQTEWMENALLRAEININLDKQDEDSTNSCLQKPMLTEWINQNQFDQIYDKIEKKKSTVRTPPVSIPKKDNFLPKILSQRKLLSDLKIPENTNSSDSLTDMRNKNDLLFSKVYEVTEDTSLHQVFRKITEGTRYGKVLCFIASYVLWFIAFMFASFIFLTFCLFLYPLLINIYSRFKNRFRSSPDENAVNTGFRLATNIVSFAWKSVINIFLQRRECSVSIFATSDACDRN